MCHPRQILRRQEFPKLSIWQSEGCWATPPSTRRIADSAVLGFRRGTVRAKQIDRLAEIGTSSKSRSPHAKFVRKRVAFRALSIGLASPSCESGLCAAETHSMPATGADCGLQPSWCERRRYSDEYECDPAPSASEVATSPTCIVAFRTMRAPGAQCGNSCGDAQAASPVVAESGLQDRRADSNADSNPIEDRSVHKDRRLRSHA
jgi:hypothetical protein